ncbi:hypothetical protein, partial [Paenibacillus sp. GbtcB18]|uniref:hypothetical protein n=1 Tax=Paenibacillus sp. GbtcB18 TaxID=2824763 RepID=UPI001C2F31FF
MPNPENPGVNVGNPDIPPAVKPTILLDVPRERPPLFIGGDGPIHPPVLETHLPPEGYEVTMVT